MFEVLTMEGWNDIMREQLDEYPWAWAFFIPFILFTVWAILNLFTAVIVDALQDGAMEKVRETEEKIGDELQAQGESEIVRHREIMEQIAALRLEIQTLKDSR
jgi:voltage-gated sodium channel